MSAAVTTRVRERRDSLNLVLGVWGIVVFVFLQRYIVGGLTAGATKS
jgi:hypothetical protein